MRTLLLPSSVEVKVPLDGLLGSLHGVKLDEGEDEAVLVLDTHAHHLSE